MNKWYRHHMRLTRTILFTGHITLVAIIATYAISLGADHGLLIPLAVPFAIVTIAALYWLPITVQMRAWGFLTFWLLSFTYLGHGSQEYAALIVITVLSLLGILKSPWFLVAIWALHPLWDMFIHRDLALPLQSLPLACLLYDLVIAIYLFVVLKSKRATVNKEPTPKIIAKMG